MPFCDSSTEPRISSSSSGSDYEVEVTNLAEAITGDHFKYFYNIVSPQPEKMWYFAAADSLGLPAAGTNRGVSLRCWHIRLDGLGMADGNAR